MSDFSTKLVHATTMSINMKKQVNRNSMVDLLFEWWA